MRRGIQGRGGEEEGGREGAVWPSRDSGNRDQIRSAGRLRDRTAWRGKGGQGGEGGGSRWTITPLGHLYMMEENISGLASSGRVYKIQMINDKLDVIIITMVGRGMSAPVRYLRPGCCREKTADSANRKFCRWLGWEPIAHRFPWQPHFHLSLTSNSRSHITTITTISSLSFSLSPPFTHSLVLRLSHSHSHSYYAIDSY